MWFIYHERGDNNIQRCAWRGGEVGKVQYSTTDGSERTLWRLSWQWIIVVMKARRDNGRKCMDLALTVPCNERR